MAADSEYHPGALSIEVFRRNKRGLVVVTDTGKGIDAVLLPHTLEYAHSPHNVLREADRILSDRGRLFVLGFNPWGGWILRQRLGFRNRAFPPAGRFYGAGRLCDWLQLLDFEVMEVRRFGVGFPRSQNPILPIPRQGVSVG